MRIKFLVLFLNLTNFLLLPAQNLDSYAGYVQDAQGSRVPGAIVRAYQGSIRQEVRAGEDGSFKILLPQKGTVLLSAETAELASVEPYRAEKPSTDIELIIQLQPMRNSVSVTADSLPVDIGDTGKSVDILDAEVLARRGEIFLLDSLRVLPGMQVQQTGGPGSLGRIVTRGLRTSDTSILIDGFRFRDVTTIQGDASSLLFDLLVVNPDRFEVCRGSESTLYGTHAIGGVINIATAQGGGPTRGELTLEGGGLGLWRGLVKGSGGNELWQWTAAANHLNVVHGVDGNDPYRNSGAQGFVRRILGNSTSLSARLFTTDGFALYNSAPGARAGVVLPAGTIPGTVQFFQPQREDPDSRRATRTYMGMAGLDHSFTTTLLLRLQYNRLHSNRIDANGPGGAGFQARFRDFNRFNGDLDTLAARTTYIWGGQQVSLFGYEWEREYFYNFSDDNNPNPVQRSSRTVDVTQLSQALYMQQQFRFGRGWTLNAGGRYQRFHLRQPNFSGGQTFFAGGNISSPPSALTGDVSAAYTIAKTGTKLRSHLGNSYRAPSMYERFGTSLFAGSFSIFGDPNLKPDRAISIDAGIDQSIWNNRLRASSTYFYTRLQEVVGFGPVPREPFGRSSGYLNTGGGIARGVETSLAAQVTRRWAFNSAYTYVNARERRPIFVTGELEPQRVSPHVFSLTSTYFWSKRFDTSLDYYATSSYLAAFFATGGTRAFRFPGQRKADLSARYRLVQGERQKWELYTRLENLANQTYYEAGYLTPGFWGTAGLRWNF